MDERDETISETSLHLLLLLLEKMKEIGVVLSPLALDHQEDVFPHGLRNEIR